MTVRREVERRSGPVLVLVGQLPRWVVALAVVLVLAGVALLPSPASLVCLAAVLALLAWLSYLSWPALPPPSRVLRVLAWCGVLVLGLVVAR